jgi:23S rRNA C2498 (ribose-2'-O)-methylase RlmM
MEKLIIQEELKNSPGILFYPNTNKLELFGRSIPENPELIFKRFDDWLTLHFKKSTVLNVNIRLEYINSGSSKYLYEILKRLTGYQRTGMQVRMKWLYEEEDEAMLELGEHYRDTAGIPLEIEMIV